MSWFFQGLRAPTATTHTTKNPSTSPVANTTDVVTVQEGQQLKKRQIIVATQNVWSHYFATPADQLRVSTGLKKRYGAAFNVMNGLNFHARLTAIAHSIKSMNVDVVLVQELFLLRLSPFITVSHNFIAFTEMMKEIGLVHHTDPTLSLPYYFGQNSGLVIYSRFPIKEEESNVFAPDTAEKLNNKGVIGVVVEIGGGGGGEDETSTTTTAPTTGDGESSSGSGGGVSNETVVVDGESKLRASTAPTLLGFVSTHLDSTAPNSIRFAQLDRVKDMILTLRRKIAQMSSLPPTHHTTTGSTIDSDEGATIVVGGDFNICPQVVSEGGFDDGTQYKALVDSMSSVQLGSVFGVHDPKQQQQQPGQQTSTTTADLHHDQHPHTIENCTLDHLFVPISGIPHQREMGPSLDGVLHRDDQLRLVIPWRGVLRASSLDGSGGIPVGKGTMEVHPACASDHLGLYTKIYV